MVVMSVRKDSDGPSAPSQQEHIPAWKRLGLKLKSANDLPHIISSINGIPGSTLKRASPDVNLVPTGKQSSAEHLAKRRRVEFHADKPAQSNGKLARPSARFPEDQKARLKKRVSFTAETKLEDGGKELITGWEEDNYAYYEQKAAENDAKEAQKKSEKSKISSKTPSSTPRKSKDALDYLNLYHSSRNSWKFNKNREVWILRHILSTDEIPASFNIALASYVRGLRSSQARSRLVSQCREALEKEGPKNPPGVEDASDFGDMEDQNRPKAYHYNAVRRFKRSLEDHVDDAHRTADEDDVEYQRWLSQRRRAELLIWAVTPSNSSTETDSSIGREVRSDPQCSLRLKLMTEGSPNGTLPRGRLFKRKNRTAVVEVSSSSEDESGVSDDRDDASKPANVKGVSNGVTASMSSSDESSSAASSKDSDSGSGSESVALVSRSTSSVSF